jgi:hypothetical protein
MVSLPNESAVHTKSPRAFSGTILLLTLTVALHVPAVFQLHYEVIS